MDSQYRTIWSWISTWDPGLVLQNRQKWFVRTLKIIFSDTFFEILGCRVLFRAVFSSAEWFRTEFREFASLFVPRKGIPSCFLFRWSDRKRNPRDCFYFLFNGTEFRVLFSSAEGFGTEFRDFLFRGTAGIPSEITICSVYSVFRGIIFLSEIPNPTYKASILTTHWINHYCIFLKIIHF